jgi:hypothetical protein
MRSLALVLTFSIPPLALAQDGPSLKLPPTVTARPAEISEVRAETTGKTVVWVVLTPGLSVRPIDSGKTLLFSGPAGRYELLSYTALGDVPSQPARVVVVIEGGDPAPPPKPADGLKKKLEAALKTDGAAKADVLQLAAIYREAAKGAADPEVSSSRELLSRVRKVSADLIGPDALPTVRGTAAEELFGALGMTSDDPLTEAQRKRTAELFTRLAATLEDLVK